LGVILSAKIWAPARTGTGLAVRCGSRGFLDHGGETGKLFFDLFPAALRARRGFAVSGFDQHFIHTTALCTLVFKNRHHFFLFKSILIRTYENIAGTVFNADDVSYHIESFAAIAIHLDFLFHFSLNSLFLIYIGS